MSSDNDTPETKQAPDFLSRAIAQEDCGIVIMDPSNFENLFASQGMRVKVIDSGTMGSVDGNESPKKRLRKDVDEDELTECCHCAKKLNIAYVVSTSEDGKDLCVVCVIEEAIHFASERGYLPGCTLPDYKEGGARLHYALNKLTSHFNGGWAEFSNGN